MPNKKHKQIVAGRAFVRQDYPARWQLALHRLQDVTGLVDHPAAPQRAYVDRVGGWCVQVWSEGMDGCQGTPWEGALRVAVKHTRATNPIENQTRGFGFDITWDELQAIKDHFWPGRIAIEIYPPKQSVVNVAEMRWLWVLPPGAGLPFNLQASSPHALRSVATDPEAGGHA